MGGKRRSTLPEKARGNESIVKSVIITSFDKEGMIYNLVVLNGETVNAEYYLSVLHQLIQPHIQRKLPHYTKPLR